ncbi:TPA: hypothetical protein N0F65_002772 [Lagenidium giganteum]|uniref:Uncharacterized protein n=1 Tax=Lagenidium giganteum TaxID=4803 RepID=A0AAV2YNY2_9STRA|nr:TPA: hypothetical protein N0F65_002772 [Lagenidium giganteum]
MTKAEFKAKIQAHFADEVEKLKEDISYAQLEIKKAQVMANLLTECVDHAAEKFGWYGVYEKDEVFTDAVTWIANVCLAV